MQKNIDVMFSSMFKGISLCYLLCQDIFIDYLFWVFDYKQSNYIVHMNINSWCKVNKQTVGIGIAVSLSVANLYLK